MGSSVSAVMEQHFSIFQLFKLGAESLLKGAALEQQSGSNDTAVLQQ
jgi:hypothetical protein